MTEAASDEGPELLARVASGDPQAFRQLSSLYLAPTLNFAYRVLKDRSEAEDVAQETFLRVWNKAETYSKGNAKGWILRIAHNLCIDRLRKRRESLSDSEEEAPSSAPTPSRLLAEKRTADRVNAALDRLPARQRIALSLVHFEGMSGVEAATIMNLNLRAVESLLARGRKNLRRELGAEDRETSEERETT
jgi:RNA polymerase sigma-70 factor (ECF subfamily)